MASSYSSSLRDRFPIRCTICQQIILPTQHNEDGELTAEGEPYRVTGMVALYPDGPDKGCIPQSTHSHLSCLGVSWTPPRARPLTHMINVCEHCGKEIGAGDICVECQERIQHDSRKGVVNEALIELMRNLAQMRATSPEPLPNPLPEPIPSVSPRIIPSAGQTQPGMLNRLPSNSARTTGLIENPERLGEFEPTTESGVIFMFGRVIGDLDYKMVYMDGRYPDSILRSPTNKLLRVEFEYRSSNFIAHQHNPEFCDLVVCWLNDRALSIQTLALHDFFDPLTGGFDFTPMRRGQLGGVTSVTSQ